MRKILCLLFLVYLLCGNVFAANLYVDPLPAESGVTWSGTDGEAYTSTDELFPGAGVGYADIQTAINAMSMGDKLYLRGGTYITDHIDLPTAINGTAWTEGNYNYIGSYPGEWAILDGNGDVKTNGYSVIGQYGRGYFTEELNYWKFERLEITGGGDDTHAYAYGFFGNVGPFWFRFCSIHDNYVRDGGTGSVFVNGGLSGYMWEDSIVEYCYLSNNGKFDPATSSHNVGEINIASDYAYATIRTEGFDPSSNSGRHRMRNTFRYNYFDSSHGGFCIKDKAGQFFTSRVSFDDTYNTYGNKIHHNYFYKGGIQDYSAIDCTTDFTQIYNNIFDTTQGIGYMFGEGDVYTVYKGVSYNNTIVNPTKGGVWRTFYEWEETYSPYYYGYDYNNLIDGSPADSGPISDFSLRTLSFEAGEPDFSNYVGTTLYSYRPTDEFLYRIGEGASDATSYTASTYATLFPGKTLWTNSYDAGNLLFLGSTGADRFRVYGSHVISGSTTIANGGVGGNHPYLTGVTLPSYIGAVNPSDDDWVAGVLALDVTYFTSAEIGSDPAWIEGTSTPEPSTTPPTINMTTNCSFR